MIVVIDNYDSFIYNIVQYIGEFYPQIKVFRNDRITVEEVLAMNPDGIIISPGPGRPEDAGISPDLIRNTGDVPLLGVCLGHQAIALVEGAEIISAKNILHGKKSAMTHVDSGIFKDTNNPLSGIRYHSLVANPRSLPDSLEITAKSDDNEIMGLKIKGKEIYGIQFHPESFLTEDGKKIIRNFVEIVANKRSQRISSQIKSYLNRIVNRTDLTDHEAEEMMDFIMQGEATQAQTACYLTALSMKGETSGEIAGSARSMFRSALKIESRLGPMVDTCGTGGDHSGIFNLSTAVAFVVAGAGIYVAKHGNRSVTSKSGSADVLEKLGININLNRDEMKTCIELNRFGFMFAPLYHPAMKNVMPVRRELGVRTLFNILGPIVNPAGVKRHVMGVFSRDMLLLIAPVFRDLGHEHSMVIYGEPNLDEATIEGLTHIKEIRNGEIIDKTLDAADYGLDGKLENLKVTDSEESAQMILNIMNGSETGDPKKAVLLNAALVISVAKDIDIDSALKLADQSITSGAALKVLDEVKKFTQAGF